MDFLDPRKKRSTQIKLLAGYVLVAIVITLATVILFYGASGYGINTKTGQIIENGLLFVDSQPGGADVYLNGKLQPNKTAARLVLPAGAYKLTVAKDGYRSWNRTFVLHEHSIERYIYPYLIPTKPQLTDLKSYPSLPTFATESPDRHWLLINQPGNISQFDEYDTSNLAAASQQLALPAEVFTADATASTLKLVEWSTDNKHVLLEHDYSGGKEFIVFDRSDPTKSFNVNRLFKIDPTKVLLRNKKIDQLYLYNQADASLQVGDTGQGVLAPAFLKHVIDFKPYGSTLLTYITDEGAPPGNVQARIWDDGKTYTLDTFKAGNNYLIDAAQFQSHWYYVAGSDTAQQIKIYKDPLDNIKDSTIAKALPLIGFNLPGANMVNFSDNARFIGLQSGQDAAVYDIETDNAYHYTFKSPIASPPLRWMDGHRFIGQSNGSVYIVDYDNTNGQLVTPSIYPDGGFFSRDFQQMITFAQSPTSGITLERVDMRAGVDLPKNGQQ